MAIPANSATSRWQGIDVARCINLADERPDRKAAMEQEFHKVGLDNKVAFFHAKRSPHGPLVGVYESHRACIREAYDDGANTLLVFEDDVVFHDGWEEVRMEVATYLRHPSHSPSTHADHLFLTPSPRPQHTTGCRPLPKLCALQLDL